MIAPPDPFDAGPHPLLLRHPTLSASSIAFVYAGDLWTVPRSGGRAARLTSAPGGIQNPYYSPDGSQIAFSASYDGNTDVFVMPATGGVPKRLTSHPSPDLVEGWTPDGKSILYSSSMISNTDYPRLFTVMATGGMPRPMPFPSGVEACFSPDGNKIAYVPNDKWELAWKRYRGGQTTPIVIGALSDSRVTRVPRSNTNDRNPMWVGDSIYYLSDPHGPVGLNRFDTRTGRVTEVIPGSGFDLKSACAGPDAIVYERLGSIHLYDPKSGADHPVPIQVEGDFGEVRPEIKNVSGNIEALDISPTGQRAVIGARGWVFTVPAKKGDVHLLDGVQGVHRRNPAWSPDGKTVAYISDQPGHQVLALYDLATNHERFVDLADAPAFYNSLAWSPDSKKIAYTDTQLTIWILDVASGKSIKVDSGTYRGASDISPQWSPDSKWLTWSRDLITHFDAVFLYSLDSGRVTQVTDSIAEATSPVFDRSGKALYFLVSTDYGLSMDFEDIESMNAANITCQVYALVLRKDLPNPLQPESDEETGPKEKLKEAEKEKPFGIDLDDLESRIILLPMPKKVYRTLIPGPKDTFFAISHGPRPNAAAGGGMQIVENFKVSDRKSTVFGAGISAFGVSADGNKAVVQQGGAVKIVSTEGDAMDGEPIDTESLEVKIDPRAEWTAMYHEAWRDERLLFYDEKLHGIDSVAMERRYEPFLAGIQTRNDLNYLFTDMMGEVCVGHMFIGGGDMPGSKRVPGGLLGADFSFSNGRYRLDRVYTGERWNPELYAPLAQPGINAKVGEYLLAIDGHDLTSTTDLYDTLEGKAGKQVKVKLGPTPDGKDSREVTVVPVGSEFGLRFRAWAEDNRHYVERATGGRAGYVHVPDTSGEGFDAFNRYYYAQSDKHGMIVDDRFNHGGYIDDFMVREMEKPLDFGSTTRHGQDMVIPLAAVYGPKVMLINEMAGSGGDIFPFLFRQHGVGKLVGKRTWGAMLSAYGFGLIDGGSIRAPDDAMYNPVTGRWIIENEGTPPDIEVELDPYLWRQGRDAQLEAAVAELNKQMEAHPPLQIKRPSRPDKSKLPGQG